MPFDPVLTLETAALMLVAFVVGATIGSLLHLAVLRLRAAPAITANTAAVPVGNAAEALVAAPVIAPLAVPRDPVMPTEIPVPDFAAGMAVPPPRPEIAPARKPGSATFGRDVGRHDREVPPAKADAIAASDTEEDTPRIEPDFFATAESLPGETPPSIGEAEASEDTATTPSSGDKSGDSETEAAPPAIDVTAELLALAPTTDIAEVQALLVETETSAIDPDEAAAMRAIEGNWTPGRRTPPAEPPAEAMAEAPPETAATPPVAAAEPSEPETVVEIVETLAVPDIVVTEDDELEEAAMDAAPLSEVPDVIPQHEEDRIVPAEPSDEPEAEEPELRLPAPVAAPAAQDQPPGLGAPRYGMRDDLTQIVGVLPVVETTLNRLGVYHFDQVADWSDAHAGWVEAHLAIAGRVEREHWREQARELAAIASGKRPSRKKRPS